MSLVGINSTNDTKKKPNLNATIVKSDVENTKNDHKH